jgi:hypothetical protein
MSLTSRWFNHLMAAWISSRLCVPSQNGRLAVCLQLHNQYSLSSVTVNFTGRKFICKNGLLCVPSHIGWNNKDKITCYTQTCRIFIAVTDWPTDSALSYISYINIQHRTWSFEVKNYDNKCCMHIATYNINSGVSINFIQEYASITQL